MPVPYLDNGIIKVGIDTAQGGLINWLSESGSSTNLTTGEFIQQGAAGHPYNGEEIDNWDGWNPNQMGDGSGNYSTVLNWNNNGTTIYCKTKPLQWFPADPYDPPDPECYFEQWLTLVGPLLKIKYRLSNYGPDHSLPPALACSSGNGGADNGWENGALFSEFDPSLSRYAVYDGNAPWTNGTISYFDNDDLTRCDAPLFDGDPLQPKVNSSEHWMAAINPSTSFGVGVCVPMSIWLAFSGGRSGMMPANVRGIKATAVYDYTFYMTIGTISDIRSRFANIRDSLVPKRLVTTEYGLFFDGCFGATSYRLYSSGVRWPDASTEYHSTFIPMVTPPANLTVSAVIDGIEGSQSLELGQWVPTTYPAIEESPFHPRRIAGKHIPGATVRTL